MIRYPLLLAVLGLIGCDGGEKPVDDTGFTFVACEGAGVTLTLPASPLQGDVTIQYTLVHPSAEFASVVLTWSDDGGQSWTDMDVEGTFTDLPTSAQGVPYEVVWDTADAVGYTSVGNISVKIVAQSACGAWEKAQVDGLSIDNTEVAAPSCTITPTLPADPSDGPLSLEFVVTHPDSTPVYATVEWSVDGGLNWADASLSSEDCDGDGVSDGLTDLTTSPEGTPHCVAWDTLADIHTDASVTLRTTCGVGFEEQDSVDIGPFTVANDPAPGTDELAITELMPTASYAQGTWLEIYNLTQHPLNLDGLAVSRWRSSADTAGAPTSTFTIDDVTGTLYLDPGMTFLLAPSDDPASTGCLAADYRWGSAFSLNTDSVLRLLYGETVVNELRFLSDEGWGFDEGVSMAMDPAWLGTPYATTLTSWCPGAANYATCPEAGTDSFGTPGEMNPGCG